MKNLQDLLKGVTVLDFPKILLALDKLISHPQYSTELGSVEAIVGWSYLFVLVGTRPTIPRAPACPTQPIVSVLIILKLPVALQIPASTLIFYVKSTGNTVWI